MAQWWNQVASSVGSGSNGLVNAVRSVSSSELVDGLPLASQGKSVLQALSGDRTGAQQTQENFSRRCVGVSQIRAALEHHNGDEVAAAATRAEFSRNLQLADTQARAAISVAVPVVAGTVQHIAESAEQAAQRLRDSELASELEKKARFGIQAADQAAQQFAESDLGKRFERRFEQLFAVQHRCGARSQGNTNDTPVSSLNDFTILTQVAPCQVGVECTCCLEPLQAGESIRMLPCFHALHQKCADKWLYAHPICPVCRCDIRSSLEEHGR